MLFRKNLLVFSLFLFIIATVAFCMLTGEYSFTYFLVLILFVIAAIPFVIAIMRNSFDIFEVIYAFSFLYVLYFGIRTVYILNTPEEFTTSYFLIRESIDRALLYVILGLIMLFLGYYSGFPRLILKQLRQLDFNPNNNRIISAIVILYIIGMASRSFYFIKGRDLYGPTIYNLIDYLFVFAQWSFLLAAIYYFSKKRTIGVSFLLWFVFLPIEGFFSFLRPGRGYFLPLFFGPLIAYHYLRKKINPFSLIIPLLILLLCIFPVVSIVKGLMWQGYDPRMGTFGRDIKYLHDEVVVDLKQLTPAEYMRGTYHQMMNRFHGIDSLTTVITYTPEAIDFQYGKTIIATLGFLIPQFIRDRTFLKFLDTDVHSLGRRFGSIYYGSSDESAGVAITQIAELYLNFAICGIIIGMFILGVFYKTFYLYFIKKNPHYFSLFVYIILWFWVVMPELWFIHAYENIIKQYLLLLAILWYLNGGKLFKRPSKVDFTANQGS